MMATPIGRRADQGPLSTAASFFEALRRRAQEVPQSIAAIDGIAAGGADAGGGAGPRNFASRLTYAELCCNAEQLAGALAEQLQSVGLHAQGNGRWGSTEGAVLATAMQRGNCWYQVFWGAVRLQASVVAFSVDLPDAKAERQRNVEILVSHRPLLVIVDEAGEESLRHLLADGLSSDWTPPSIRHFVDLWQRARGPSPPPAPRAPESADAALCYCYTGGTTKASRCAVVTHRMALHEVEVYPQVVRLQAEDRVLQQHSVYWAASAYGEVDIALAFGCALVFVQAWDTEGVAAAIRLHGATCAGLVPSMLAALEHRDVPTLRCVFTWGEALQVAVAREWAKRVRLIDLLISTECWLSLYADWSAAGEESLPMFQTVQSTRVRLRPVSQDGAEREKGGAAPRAGSAGELLVAGPMVSPGYTDVVLNSSAFERDARGTTWYCTKDCLEQHGAGFRFAGRADDMIKVGGVWVDTRDIETRIRGVAAVAEACIARRDAFVVVRHLDEGVVPELRAILPQDFALFLVPSLPRSAGTGKVDRRQLAELVGQRGDPVVRQKEEELGSDELGSLIAWYRPLYLLVVAACFYNRNELTEPFLAEDPANWIVGLLWRVILFLFAAAVDLLWRLLSLSYVVLWSWHLSGRQSAWCSSIPLKEYGVMLLACALAPGPLWGLALAAPGVCWAVYRRRLFSWPLVCAFGFPVWVRDAGWWMRNRPPREVIAWYAQKLITTPRQRVADAVKRASWATRKFLGISKECTWCKARLPASLGHTDKKVVGAKWYCKACWRHYDNHMQCTRCKLWSVKGTAFPAQAAAPGSGEEAVVAAGTWLCWLCHPLPQSQPSGVARRSPPKSVATPQAAATIQRRVISLSSCTPAPAGHPPQLSANGLKRPAPEDHVGEAADQPPEKARRCDPQPPPPGGSGPAQAPIAAADEAVGGETATAAVEEVPAKKPRTADPAAGAAEQLATTNHVLVAQEAVAPSLAAAAAMDVDMCAHQPARPAAVVARAGGRGQGATSSTAKSKEWKIIEKATGMAFDSPDDSLSSLDSLRHTKMTSALRREAGKRLPRQVLKNAATIGGLLEELSRLQEEEPQCSGPAMDRAELREYAAWGIMWGSRCQWVLRSGRPLPERVFREAVGKLVARHAALRAELRDPYRLFTAVQQALSAFLVWRKHYAKAGCVACASHLIARAARWSLKRAWPRVGGRACSSGIPQAQIKVLEPCKTMQDAEWKLWGAGREFEPPFRAMLVQYGEGAEAGALVHLTVTHMLSDGYSVVPLLDDLANIVATIEAESADQAGPRTLPLPLPPVPSMFGVMERRIMRTIDGSDDGDGQCPRITPHALSGKTWRNAHMTFATLPAETVAEIRRCAARLAVPDDIAMLTLLGVTLTWFSRRSVQQIAMIVPQRDGPGENDMVGLFSDVRHVCICTAGLSFAGVALQLHHVVKERLWSVPELRTQFDLTLLNFEWTDFQEKQGFTQHVTTVERGESSFHPLRVAVDQPEFDVWRLRVAFQEGQFDEQRREEFFTLFERSLGMLRERPLDLVWTPSGDEQGLAQ